MYHSPTQTNEGLIMTIKCFFTGHNLMPVARRHNGYHFICVQCGKKIWYPCDTENGKWLFDNYQG